MNNAAELILRPLRGSVRDLNAINVDLCINGLKCLTEPCGGL